MTVNTAEFWSGFYDGTYTTYGVVVGIEGNHLPAAIAQLELLDVSDGDTIRNVRVSEIGESCGLGAFAIGSVVCVRLYDHEDRTGFVGTMIVGFTRIDYFTDEELEVGIDQYAL